MYDVYSDLFSPLDGHVQGPWIYCGNSFVDDLSCLGHGISKELNSDSIHRAINEGDRKAWDSKRRNIDEGLFFLGLV